MLVGRVFNMLSLIRALYHNHNKSQDLKIGTYTALLYLLVTSFRLPLSLMKKFIQSGFKSGGYFSSARTIKRNIEVSYPYQNRSLPDLSPIDRHCNRRQ